MTWPRSLKSAGDAWLRLGLFGLPPALLIGSVGAVELYGAKWQDGQLSTLIAFFAHPFGSGCIFFALWITVAIAQVRAFSMKKIGAFEFWGAIGGLLISGLYAVICILFWLCWDVEILWRRIVLSVVLGMASVALGLWLRRIGAQPASVLASSIALTFTAASAWALLNGHHGAAAAVTSGVRAVIFVIFLSLATVGAPLWLASCWCHWRRLQVARGIAGVQPSERKQIAWYGLGFAGVFGSSFTWAVMRTISAYEKLPTSPPGNCFIATAALAGGGAPGRQALAALKTGELALLAGAPGLHRELRRFYDRIGPPSAAWVARDGRRARAVQWALLPIAAGLQWALGVSLVGRVERRLFLSAKIMPPNHTTQCSPPDAPSTICAAS